MVRAPKCLILLVALGALLAPLAWSAAALAQKPTKAAPKAKAKPKKGAEAAKPAAGEADSASKEAASAEKATPEAEVKAAGTEAAAAERKKPEPDVVTEEDDEKSGVKTYHFSGVEVEGRLKSPQIIYFLRRVRAEFDAGLLGHRSFMPELSDSRRSPSLR